MINKYGIKQSLPLFLVNLTKRYLKVNLINSPFYALGMPPHVYETLVAHGGFDSGKCRMTGCTNDKLLGRELCYLHLPFPYPMELNSDAG
ncbi:hypothetical protein CTN06_06890 [Pectobacterium zantedeschiae]|uniref:Uncharacterized protein n=1 Tax=Pectobacterium zantedeschiae TaxID=2034769 RepID=A0A9X8P4P0_9GAMM|nr:hypothetical protein CLR69_00725 [Pectobacterium zantedeschiae]RYC49161.1 hypothetical protein CTN06_06890 [Pectobacterium zantedeschiae]